MEKPYPSQSPPRLPHHSAPPAPGQPQPHAPLPDEVRVSCAQPGGPRRPGRGAKDPEGSAARAAIHSATPQQRGRSCCQGGGDADGSSWAIQVQPWARSLGPVPRPVRHHGSQEQPGGLSRSPREQKSRCGLVIRCCPLSSSRWLWRQPGLLGPSQSPSPGAGTQVPHSPPGELCRSLTSFLRPPGLTPAPPQPEVLHKKQQSSSDKESVTLRARPSPVGGGAREGPLRCSSNPDHSSIAHPLGNGVGVGVDLTCRFPLLQIEFLSFLPPLPEAFAKGGGGTPR